MKEKPEFYELFDDQWYDANIVVFLTPWERHEDKTGRYYWRFNTDKYIVLRLSDIREMLQVRDRECIFDDDGNVETDHEADFIVITTVDGKEYMVEEYEISYLFQKIKAAKEAKND